MVSELAYIHLSMQIMLVAWVTLVLLIARRTIAQGSVGLPAALALTMSFLYGGCFVYAVPGYTHLRPDGHWYLQSYGFTELMVVKATFASLLGLLGLAVGSGCFSVSKLQNVDPPNFVQTRSKYNYNVLLVLGTIAVVSFTLNYLRVSFPLSGALLEVGRNIAVVFVCLGATLAIRRNKSLSLWIFLAALVPAYYLFLFAFVSYGFLFGTVLIAFWMAQISRRSATGIDLRKTIITLFIIYALLTAFVGWFSFRDEIRILVWEGEGKSIFSILGDAVTETEFFSLWNFASLDLVNIRLNLNIFVGLMMDRHENFPELRQYGATLIVLPLVLIPRFLWPGKPARGGSDFMAEHTGLTLSDSATFGTGTIFEFFINFGYVGVLVGFMALGWLLSKIDRAAARKLASGDFMSFAKFYVIGIVMIDPLLRPFFVVNGAVFAWIVMTALKFAIVRKRKALEDHETETITLGSGWKNIP